MHRIGIISDTHGLLRPEVAEVLKDCEAILHAGDVTNAGVLDELNEIAPLHAVCGNCDKWWVNDLPDTLFVELYGLRFFVIHDRDHIPKNLKDVDIIVFGHSHDYEEKYVNNVFMLNPGSCGPKRFTKPITFAVLEVEEDRSFRVQKYVIEEDNSFLKKN